MSKASASTMVICMGLGLLILQGNCLAQNKPRVRDFGNSLQDAAKEGDLERVDRLITQGADVNAIGKNGNTALTRASSRGHGQIVNLLLKNGANVNAKVIDDLTALFLAAAEGHVDIVKVLLKNGARWTLTQREKMAPQRCLNPQETGMSTS